ncbi:hypothetical protein QYS62_010836 [Fusarium acuminatum]|uniref:Uncharacterized protein n=1 Tax=Fusarium acuminatum TaxID=5515 RepID=A0ABZ2X9D0_9HYPO
MSDVESSHSGDGGGYPTAISYASSMNTSSMLLVREVAMMIIMDRLTDKPDWHVKVFDDTIANKWIEEALALPVEPLYDDIVPVGPKHARPKKLTSILDRGCLEYCIKELRAKAKCFEKSGLVPTLDATATVVKSDSLVDEELRGRLHAAFATLQHDQKDDPDWHPRTNDMVQNLIHPSLYPFVYGRSRAFMDEVVGVEDAVHRWSGKGEVIPKDESSKKNEHFSDTYQWLPSDVKIQEDGSVKFASYINGLHPNKYPEIYATIEKLIETALPAWDLCLVFDRDSGEDYKKEIVAAGRTKARFPRPRNPDDENEENWTPYEEVFTRAQRAKRGDPEKEESISNPPSSDSEDYEDDSEDEIQVQSEGGSHYNGTRDRVAWEMAREPVQPQAPEFKALDYDVKPGDSLRERFVDIQVIVKMASIELTPDKPEFPAGSWHVEGQENEHIIGTALYYLDSENVTPSHLHFRMQTEEDPSDWNIGQDAFRWMERVYGTKLRGADCLQQYGSVGTRQGRLLAFPNVFHHRVSPFELQDKTKPGHRRFIALWLVDPYIKPFSTSMVPPQQQSWWLEKAFGDLSTEEAEKIPNAIANLLSEATSGQSIPALEAAVNSGTPLPKELMDMVKKEAAKIAGLMSLEEAKEHRLKLMDERSRFQGAVEDEWRQHEYNFCEH